MTARKHSITQNRLSLKGGSCICDKSIKPKKRVAKAGCPDDADAVATLPDNWVPRHSGAILANYLKKREQDHEKVLADINEGATAVNKDIDKRVHDLAKNLLISIQQNQRCMDCIFDQIDLLEGPITTEARDDAMKSIRELMSKRVDNMALFKREALGLERERADKLRILLRGQFQRLVSVGHKTPKNLLHEFDEKIYDINQQILSNSRAYSELEAELKVQADESVLHARSAINQLCLGVGMNVRGKSALIWCKDENISRQRQSASAGRPQRASEPTIGNILNDVEEFDAVVTRLVQAYRNAVIRVFAGFATKLSELEKDLGSHHDLLDKESVECQFPEIQRIIEKPLTRLSNIISKTNSQNKLQDITNNDLLMMEKSLLSLGENLRETYSILHHAGHLWDAHILRSAHVKKLTIAAVEDLLTNNDTIELSNEIPFNIALEQLRCASDADKLNQQFDAITAMLDKTADMYLHHSEAELGRLEEFMNLTPIMASALLAEFNLFLEKYPRHPKKLPSSGSPRVESDPGTPLRSSSSIQLPLPRAILQTELQEVALKNWRNGFLESFEANVSLVPEELQHQARLWVEERSAPLHMRYSLKMISHGIRLERVKAARDRRLQELRYHEARLDSHLNAIFDLIDRLPEEASQFAALDAPFLYPLTEWLDRLNEKMQEALNQVPLDPEIKKLKMKSYRPRLIKYKQLFEESLNVAVADKKRQLEHRTQEARVSNVRFISQIKLFSEGGQYSASEATKTCTALNKGAEALELSLTKALDALNQRKIQLLALADNNILPLQRVVEETVKTNVKSNAKLNEKKKSPAKKK
ncbi:unnamed protein product [Chrysodeixis includens]|uniref:DUF4455 domain-containing protein n=1 Tax=Chrysodeixis includens TaxID=689277 RepID=A0A9P0FUB2_CHRIL|nr:unnamed protein product [Chrysodeixis includens]